MASLGGVSNSNALSSLMRSANMISGLASGMDTEGMIEQLVKSYQMKINQYNQKITKVEWKQDSYRSIINKLVSLSDKYTSYTSSTNLMSKSFFNNAVTVSALGKYASAVSATGKTSSDIALNAVTKLATAAKYRTQGNLDAGDGKSIEASGEGIDLNGSTELGILSGSMTLTYGSQKVSISFDQVSDVKAMNEIREKLAEKQGISDPKDVDSTDVLAELINQKLSGQTINLSGGKTADATDRIQVEVVKDADGTKRITFNDKANAGNAVFISGASGNVGAELGLAAGLREEDKNKPRSISFSGDLTKFEDNSEYLAGRTMNMNLDGVTKTISMPRITTVGDKKFIVDSDGNPTLEYNAENYTKALNDAVQKAFGGKVTVTNAYTDPTSASYDEKLDPTSAKYDAKYAEENKYKLKLNFKMRDDGSSLVVNTDVGDALGIGRTATSYMNTSKTLGELMGDKLKNLTPSTTDKDGNSLYDFVINGVKVGSYSKDTKLSEIMNDINNSGAGVKVSYSQTTKNFLFEATETGVDSKVELGGGLAAAMFGDKDYSGTEISELLGEGITTSEFSFTINGETFKGAFDSDTNTIAKLKDKLNEILGGKYTAEYSKDKGLFFKDEEGNEVGVKYGNDALGEIAKKVERESVTGSKKLKDILHEDVGGAFAFTVNGKEVKDSLGNTEATLDAMLKKISNKLATDPELSDYEAWYDKDKGLVIRDKETKEINEDVTFGNDFFGKLADKLKVYDEDSELTGVLGKEELPRNKVFEFKVDGKTYTSNIKPGDTMDDLLMSINESLKNTQYTASISSITGELSIKDAQGKDAALDYSADSSLSAIMSAYKNKFKANQEPEEGKAAVYTKGEDAEFNVTVNGETINMKRSSNTVNIDGMSITLKDTFDSRVDEAGNPVKGEAVTFKSNTDSDRIIDVIKDLVNDYNTVMAEIKAAYGTMPYQNSNGVFGNYEPLTEEEMEGMSESAIARYEEKAKQGILFGDRTLSTLYDKLNQVFSFNNKADVDTLKDMGITVSYSISEGTQAVTIDEEKLRAMLDSDPDRVADLFTKTDGVMDRMKTQLDNYAKTTGEPKGILIQQAGSPLSSLSLLNNFWQQEIDNYTTQIETWQTKLESQVERYTSQFARLEQLIAQMNNQSSTLSSMMGY